MNELKPIDFKILFQLMKNAKISDRQLAKLIGVSQPTVTRRRARLEKEAIDGYTTIPKWEKLGYEIVSFCFFRCGSTSTTKQHQTFHKKCVEWVKKRPNVIWAGTGIGMGMHCFMISFHKKYRDYVKFFSELQNSDTGYAVSEKQSFLVSIPELKAAKPFHLKYLAETS